MAQQHYWYSPLKPVVSLGFSEECQHAHLGKLKEKCINKVFGGRRKKAI